MESDNFEGKRVLVVGGAGFVGSNLVHLILEENPKEILIVDNLLSSDESNIPFDKRVNFFRIGKNKRIKTKEKNIIKMPET